MPVGRDIETLRVTKNIWPVIHCEPGDDDVIQLLYYILLMTKSLRKLDNYCNIPKKSFTALGIMQPMEPIAIIYTPSLFNLLKAIGAAFVIGLYGLDIGC